MAKNKNYVNVKGMSLEALRTELKNASGSRKSQIVNEINRRVK